MYVCKVLGRGAGTQLRVHESSYHQPFSSESRIGPFLSLCMGEGSSRSLNVYIKFPHLFSGLLIKSQFLAPYDKPLIRFILHLVSVGSPPFLHFLPQLAANFEPTPGV